MTVDKIYRKERRAIELNTVTSYGNTELFAFSGGLWNGSPDDAMSGR